MSQTQKYQSAQSGNIYEMEPETAAKLGGLTLVLEEVVAQPPLKSVKDRSKTTEKNSSKEGK